MQTRSSFFAVLLLVFSLSSSHLLAQGGTRLGEIVREGERSVMTIRIEADDSTVQGIARRAFTLHGAFRPVNDANANVTLRLRAAGGNAVLANVTAGGDSFTVNGSGSDLIDATAHACDLVVERLLRIPGFFRGTLAFVNDRTGHREIFVGDMFFQRVRQITRDNSKSISPRLSPDGYRLLYTGYFQSGFPDIFEVNLRSGQRRPFANFRGTNNGATFSPDGSQVALILSSSGNAELYVGPAAGRPLQRLTNNRSLEASPTWSPDGRRIALTSDQPGRPQIFVISSSGGPLTRVPTNISGYCSEPTWNPRHANLIAFTIAQGGGFQVAVYDFNRRESRTVTRVSGDAIEPVWVNDGRHLIFTHRVAGTTQLQILDVETGQSQPLHSRNFGNTSQASFAMR